MVVPQRPNEHSPKRPTLLAVDHKLGEGTANLSVSALRRNAEIERAAPIPESPVFSL